MTLRKIACATDFSHGSRIALLAAAQLARKVGAELAILYAWSLPTTGVMDGYVFPPSMVDALVADGEHGLAAAAATAREAGLERVSTRLLQGNAANAVAAEVERDPTIDLVVVGTHGRTGLPRFLLGSVAQRIVRLAPCSVLVVRASSAAITFDHVACPIDFGDEAKYAAELAASLANPAGRGITLLHALELPVVSNAAVGYPAMLEGLDRAASEQLDTWAARLRDRTRAPVSAQLRTGAPAAQVLAMLDADPSYDVVVVGSHGRTGLERLLLGSVAERIVKHAKPPVLVARRRA